MKRDADKPRKRGEREESNMFLRAPPALALSYSSERIMFQISSQTGAQFYSNGLYVEGEGGAWGLRNAVSYLAPRTHCVKVGGRLISECTFWTKASCDVYLNKVIAHM